MAVKREFLIDRHGRTFVLYAGLLAEAHEQGLKSIKTHLLQIPTADNGQTAICLAEVTTERGTFTGIGDANPENTARIMVPHLVRLSETRAKARALRDAVNVGVAALEELGPDDEPDHRQAPKPGTPAPTTAVTRPDVNGMARPAVAQRPPYAGSR